ncbi:hypothetical protein IAT38_002765 [Cryptococcus sp. DSM 104549]
MPRVNPKSSTEYTLDDPKARTSVRDLFPKARPPKTPLAEYRLLAPTAGVRVSPICLGGGSLGNQWPGFTGKALDTEESFKLLDAFYEAGGNFIDTAGQYQDGQSEMIIGEWMESRGVRDEIVLSTKYSIYPLQRKEGDFEGNPINYYGNSKKNLRLSLNNALKSLRTDYIDVLYVHYWDYTTSIPELMQSLNELVKSGKVLYLGISDTPAWIVTRANEYAIQHGLAQFVIYQGMWNVGRRDLERDIIPMARAYGMSIAPYAVLGGGKFKTPEELKNQDYTFRYGPPSEQDLKLAATLTEIAKEIGEDVRPSSVGVAWARQMVEDCFPVLGGASIEQLKSNINALKITLTPEQLDKLNNVYPFDYGFPHSGFGTDPHYRSRGKPLEGGFNSAGNIKFTQLP